MPKRKNDGRNGAVNEKEYLAALLEDRQRRLSENSERLVQLQTNIRDCRERIDRGRDHSHFSWLVRALVLFAGGMFFSAFALFVPAVICCVIGGILFIRWLSDLVHCVRKFRRLINERERYEQECDRLAGECSSLRLETAELRQKLDRIE